MTQTEKQAQHTPGPLHYELDSQMILTQDGRMVVAECRGWGYLTGACGLNLSPEQAAATQDASGRLFAAAYTSYDKHCGPRAVECAKNDLLGELLEACNAMVHAQRTNDPAMAAVAATLAEAAISKAKAQPRED